MKRLKLFGFLGLLFAGFGLMWLASDFLSREQATLEPNEPLVSGAPPDPTDLAVPRPTMEEMERQLAGLPASPMDSYVKPETSRRERLQILGHLFAEYHSTFHEIPSGLQVEIFSVFRGVNDRKIAYVPDGHPALNERGLPVNPEGFPILAHVLSASQGIFELRDPGLTALVIRKMTWWHPFLRRNAKRSSSSRSIELTNFLHVQPREGG